MSDPIDLQDFIGGFVVEADELVAASTGLLLEIEKTGVSGAPHPRAVRDLFRALHTIKGLAAMIGVEPIVEISHGMEAMVRIVDRSGTRLSQGAIDVLLRGVRAIGERVRAVAEQRAPAPAPAALLQAIAAGDVVSDVAPTPSPDRPAWDSKLTERERSQVHEALRSGTRVYALTFQPAEEKVARGITIATVRTRLAELGEVVKVVPRTLPPPSRGVVFDIIFAGAAAAADLALIIASSVDTLRPIGLETTAAEVPVPEETFLEAPASVGPGIGRAVVRVALARLDDLQEQLSQLLVSRFRLAREVNTLAARGVDVRQLREIANAQARQLRDLRGAILRARLIRVAEVLEPLALLVRSLAKPGFKEVHLELDTRDAELDKAVADRLLPAIIHLVRNAIDHAIEPMEERRAAGKRVEGTLRVACRDISGNRLELSIGDDGRGIDRAAIARRAGREIANDAELLEVLTTPGFSTRDVATSTSGRGLGMDIVKRIIVDQLGGEIIVETIPKAGTTFRLIVPVTISIIDVFSFTCGLQSFVVPVSAVEEIFEIDAEKQSRPAAPRPGAPVTIVERRGSPIPMVSLGEVLTINNGEHVRKAMVVRRNGEAIAFAVDKMLGRQEVVVRPIDDPLARAPGIAGATDLGDGRPTLLLDLVELSGHLNVQERA